MSALAAAFNEKKYRRLLSAVLPKPPANDEEHARLEAKLLELEERADDDALSSEEEALAELLTIVLDDYGRKHVRFEGVTASDRLRAVLEFRGLQQKDIVPVIGNKSLVSQIINGQKKISKDVAKKLAAHFSLPADLFL
jgi:HTH-type transcriptional regulator / antitoxin HigA